MLRMLIPVLSLVPWAWAQPFVVDGQFDDWTSPAAEMSDPVGDAGGQLDATRLAGVLSQSTLHVRLDIASEQNLQAGSQPAPDLRLIIEPDGLAGLEVQFRNRVVRRLDTNEVLRWDAVGFASAPTFAAQRFEIRVDLSSLGVVGPGGVTLSLAGSDALDEPLRVPATSPAPVPRGAPIEPAPRPSVRLASLNTLRTGLFAPGQSDKLTRLLVAADADAYLLQEEYNSSESQIVSLFNTILPLDKGVWRAHKRGDTAVVSRWPLVDLPSHDSSYSAAAMLTGHGPVVLVSIHPKCCGYIGSSEDQRRIDQAKLTAQLVQEVRAGQYDGQVKLSGAPVIVGGDWNLVGSRMPLDILTAPELEHMAELRLVRTGAADTTTWRELDGLGFPPGRLDLMVYDCELLKPVRAEVLDTSMLTQDRLKQLGLFPDDSTGSDHLMLLTDFALAAQD